MSVDVIVVGGGLLGLSSALHLQRTGATTVLVEAGRVGTGTTFAGGGFVTMWAAGAFPDWGEPELDCERYAFDFYRELAADGADLDLHENGALWLATTEGGWDSHLRPIADHPAVGERVTLRPEEVERLTRGVVSAAGIVGGVLHPRAIHLSTSKAVQVLSARCRDEGVPIYEGRPVRRLATRRGRVTGVVTDDGTIAAPNVVVAAGAWSRRLLRTAGYEAPMVPLAATRLISGPLGIPTTTPMLMLEELSFLWVRGHNHRLLWGCEYDVRPRYDFVGIEPPDHVTDIDGDDAVEQTMKVARSAARAIPALERAQPVEVAHGLPCYTSDLRALVGPVPGVDGLFLISGDNQAGVTHGPGYARLLAQLVTDESATGPTTNAFRLDRFAVGPQANIAREARRRLTALSFARSEEFE